MSNEDVKDITNNELKELLSDIQKELVDFVNVASDVLSCEYGDENEEDMCIPEPLEFVDQAMGRMIPIIQRLGGFK